MVECAIGDRELCVPTETIDINSPAIASSRVQAKRASDNATCGGPTRAIKLNRAGLTIGGVLGERAIAHVHDDSAGLVPDRATVLASRSIILT